MNQIDKLITDFIEDLEVNKKRSLLTVRNYDFYLRRFSGWLLKNNIKHPKEISQKVINRYNSWLNKVKNPIKRSYLKKNTQNYHLIALRGFLKYLSRKKIGSFSPQKVKLARIISKPIIYLGESELENLLEAPLKVKPRRSRPERRQDKIIQLRDKAILELLFCTGFKVSEAANLKISQLKPEGNKKVYIVKREKSADVILSNQAYHWIKEYLKKRKDSSKYLFVSHDRAFNQRENKRKVKGLSSRSIERIVQKYASIVSINKKVTPQMIRHSFTRRILLKGKNLAEIQKLLGHSSANTIKEYVKGFS